MDAQQLTGFRCTQCGLRVWFEAGEVVVRGGTAVSGSRVLACSRKHRDGETYLEPIRTTATTEPPYSDALFGSVERIDRSAP